MLDRGWAIGTADWRKAVARDHVNYQIARGVYAQEVAELRELQWNGALDELMTTVGKTREEAKEDRCGAEWKIAIAHALRRRIGATNSWIARELSMGSGSSVSQYLSDVRAGRRRMILEA